MEIVLKSEYQDIYRLKKGVLFFVNKFHPLYNGDGGVDYIGYSKSKRYVSVRYCDLHVLTEPVTVADRSYPAGQMLFDGRPICLAESMRDCWTYQLKASGDSFSGDASDMLSMLGEVADVISGSNFDMTMFYDGVKYSSAV